jgi:hypothetical protein
MKWSSGAVAEEGCSVHLPAALLVVLVAGLEIATAAAAAAVVVDSSDLGIADSELDQLVVFGAD